VKAFETGRGTYGSPRVRDELVDQGFEIGRKRVARLMRELGLQGVCPRKFRVTTNSDHEHPVEAAALAQEPAAPTALEPRSTSSSGSSSTKRDGRLCSARPNSRRSRVQVM